MLVDIDVGMARTGVGTVEGAVGLARAVSDAEHLTYKGIQGYSGMVQHIEPLGERTEVYGAHLDHLRDVVEALRDAGLAPEIVSGGGTGTHGIDREAGLFTEHQAGSYIFMDVEYNAVEFGGTGEPPFETALFVQCSVVSNNAEGFVTIDGGFKCFATDGPKPQVAATSIKGAGFDRFGDEHGKVILPEGANEKPGLGEAILLVTPSLRPDGQSPQLLSCRRRRYAGRYLAGGRPGRFVAGSCRAPLHTAAAIPGTRWSRKSGSRKGLDEVPLFRKDGPKSGQVRCFRLYPGLGILHPAAERPGQPGQTGR